MLQEWKASCKSRLFGHLKKQCMTPNHIHKVKKQFSARNWHVYLCESRREKGTVPYKRGMVFFLFQIHAPHFWINLCLGNIHVLRKHKGGRKGVIQMLTFTYGGEGSYLRNHSLEKMLNNLHNLPNLNKNYPKQKLERVFVLFWKV